MNIKSENVGCKAVAIFLVVTTPQSFSILLFHSWCKVLGSKELFSSSLKTQWFVASRS